MNVHPTFLSSRLLRRIGTVVFFGVVICSGALFLPTHGLRQQEHVRKLEWLAEELFATVPGSEAPSDRERAEQFFQNAQQRIKADSMIVGMVLYDRRTGEVLQMDGLRPRLEGADFSQQRSIRQFVNQGKYLDLSLPRLTQTPSLLAIRYDLSAVQHQMFLFSVQTTGVILLLAAGVTLLAMGILNRLLVQALNRFSGDIHRAGAAICEDQVPQVTPAILKRADELGELSVMFQEMAYQVRAEMRDRKRVEAGLRAETDKSERLLLNILPAAIAAKLKADPGAIATRCPEATILFADIVGFTNLCAHLSPSKLVRQLNAIFSTFDYLAQRYGLEKIKTIGDAYMVVGGLTDQRVDHTEAILEMALDMQAAIGQYQSPLGEPFQLRIGINTGPVVAGVIGLHKFSYDLWGDAVNIASRMESHGLVNQIQVSEATYSRVKDQYLFEARGPIELKGRGPMNAYILMGHRSKMQSQQRNVHPQYNVEQVHALTTNLLAEVTQVSKLFHT